MAKTMAKKTVEKTKLEDTELKDVLIYISDQLSSIEQVLLTINRRLKDDNKGTVKKSSRIREQRNETQ